MIPYLFIAGLLISLICWMGFPSHWILDLEASMKEGE